MKIFARWLVNLEKSVISVGIVFLFQAVHSQSLQVPNNAFLLSEGNVGRKDGPYIGKAMSAESCESLAVLGLAASDHANRHLHVTACKEWFAKPKPASIARLEAISTDCDNAPDFSHTHHQSMRRDVVATCKRYMANPHSVREV